MAPAVCPYVSLSNHFWTNLALVLHGPVKNSSRTGTGPRTDVCQALASVIRFDFMFIKWLKNNDF